MENSITRISIVTPSYNSEKYIEDCIKSVLDQNYPNFEHIIIDGGSTDGTIEILKKYPHLKWISEPDEGQSDALNKGFKMASGDIIGWLNSDDFYHKNIFYDVILSFNDKIDAIYGNYYFVDKEGKLIKKMYEMGINIGILTYYRCYIPSTTFFFRREIIEAGILLNPNFHYSMDQEFFLRLLLKGKKIQHVNRFWASFRWHNHNKTLSTNRKSPDWDAIYLTYGVKIFKSAKLNKKIHKLLRIFYMSLRFIFKLTIKIKKGLR